MLLSGTLVATYVRIELQDILLPLLDFLHEVVRLYFPRLQHHGIVIKQHCIRCLSLLHGFDYSLQSIEFVVYLTVDLFQVLHIILFLYAQVLLNQDVLIICQLLELGFEFCLIAFGARLLFIDFVLFVEVF